MASGDFNRDGYVDLAVGAPGDDVQQREEADFGPSGTVTVLRGGPSGITGTGASVLRRSTAAATGFDVGFGASLTAADLDRDGDADLVVGSRGQEFIDEGYPGGVSYCPGAASCRRLVQDRVLANLTALATGNIAGSVHGSPASLLEIAVGVPAAHDDDPGHVLLLQLRRSGGSLAVARQLTLAQSSPGIPGSDESTDRFGFSLAVGDLDRDGWADLVIGADLEDRAAGRVTVVHGAASGWRRTGNRILSQATRGVPGRAEPGDRFGAAVTLLDHNRDGRLDLTVGAPGENGDAGAISLLRGGGRDVTTTGARTVGIRTLGWPSPAGALFGMTLGR